MRNFTFLLVVCATLAATGCNRSDGKAAGGGFKMMVETVRAGTERVEDKLNAVGSLEANELVRVQSEIDGRVLTIGFEEGAAVKAGDVLFQLDDTKLQAEVQSAEARFTKAQNNLDRARRLLEEHTLSQQEFDDADAEFKDAGGAQALARKRLADATIRSPFDGFVSERLVSAGQYIDKGRTLVTVVDTDPLKIDFSVPERFLPQVRVGQKVAVRVAAWPARDFEGEVFFVDPRVEPSTRTIKLKATIPNAAGELRPGTFAHVDLVIGARDNAVVVPEQTIVPQIDKLTVFVVADGVAHRREVVIGARLPGKVEIANGLAVGEEVVVSGQQKLRDQVPVQPMPKQG